MSEQLQLLFAFGRFLSPLYGICMSLRATCYRKGILTSAKLPVPVISVGNLTLGGTGKTPMTIYLARLLAEHAPVIVSRGYGGLAKKQVNVVADGESVLLDARQAGDEPFTMAQNLPGVPVLTSVRRADGGRMAVERFHAGCVILDDGFQHLGLRRDLDLVLFNADTFLGNNRVFPGGDMREPLKALLRAHAFVLTSVHEGNRQRAEAIERALRNRFPRTPVFKATYTPHALIGLHGEECSLAQAAAMRFFAFCGLAQPQLFQDTLQRAGLQVDGFQYFRDHCRYLAPELNFLQKKIAPRSVNALLTTEKDLVKLQGASLPLPVFALRMTMEVEESFNSFVLAACASSFASS